MTLSKLLPVLLAISLQPAWSATVFTEGLDEDLSDDYDAPTPITLMTGSNFVTFTIGTDPDNETAAAAGAIGVAGGGAADADYILFLVPGGASVTEMIVRQNTGGGHFFAIQLADRFDVTPASSSEFGNSIDNLGSPIFTGTGSNLILRLPVDPTDDFIALFQETTDVSATVTLELTVVPEPSAAALALAALPLALRRRR